ncbi:MAG TPA: response regulator [Terriglobales bacterium]|jgi:CheY-like chemotaxis protein|nr:response regulator [Terriglobales bacterium]
MCRVLLVDDEEAIRKLLSSVLEMADFKVTTAGSAREGIQKLGTEAFDLVLTDLRMETPLAGYDVVKAARNLSERPVSVIVTAFPIPPSEWRSVGADALFTKGMETIHMADQLKKLLMRKRPARIPSH